MNRQNINSDWKRNLPIPLCNDEIVGYIYKTYDFGKFDTTDYNREISDGHVDKLKASFAERDLGIASPVKTNEHSEVIDGGHTLEARKQGNFPLYHTIIEGTSAEQDIARLNMTRKSWTYEDWIKHYITRHNNSEDQSRFINYILFQNFRNRHNFSLIIQLSLFTLVVNNKSNYRDLKAGVIAHPNPDESEHRATWLGYAAEIAKDKNKEFASAMLFVYEDKNVDNDHFLAYLEKKKETITPFKKNATDWIAWFDSEVADGQFMRSKKFLGTKDGFYFRKQWKEHLDFNERVKKANKRKEENK